MEYNKDLIMRLFKSHGATWYEVEDVPNTTDWATSAHSKVTFVFKTHATVLHVTYNLNTFKILSCKVTGNTVSYDYVQKSYLLGPSFAAMEFSFAMDYFDLDMGVTVMRSIANKVTPSQDFYDFVSVRGEHEYETPDE